MPVKIIHPDHFELVGEGNVILVVPHAVGSDAGLHMGQVVEDAALVSRCYAIVGKILKEDPDGNLVENSKESFQRRITEIVAESGIRYQLHIVGKEEPGFEVGYDPSKGISKTVELVRARFSGRFRVEVKEPVRHAGLAGKSGEGENPGLVTEVLHLGFGIEERTNHRDELVNGIAEIVTLLNSKLSSEKFEEKNPEQGRQREGNRVEKFHNNVK